MREKGDPAGALAGFVAAMNRQAKALRLGETRYFDPHGMGKNHTSARNLATLAWSAMQNARFRDYVIEAFNENIAFDQFTVEQLAGDLLAQPTTRQRIASGYNRLLQTTEEGGAQPKEYTAIYQADRVRNFSTVWLATTMGCCQCHDHKFDPFTSRDFYSLAAFFADVNELPVGRQPPNLFLPTPDQEDWRFTDIAPRWRA